MNTDRAVASRVSRWYFFKPNIPIWVNLGGAQGGKNVGIFYGHLEYITAVWYIFWPFGTFVAIWYIFPRFGILFQEKSGTPGCTHIHRMVRAERCFASKVVNLEELRQADVKDHLKISCVQQF
jgi:hypothetical protein